MIERRREKSGRMEDELPSCTGSAKPNVRRPTPSCCNCGLQPPTDKTSGLWLGHFLGAQLKTRGQTAALIYSVLFWYLVLFYVLMSIASEFHPSSLKHQSILVTKCFDLGSSLSDPFVQSICSPLFLRTNFRIASIRVRPRIDCG